MGALAHPTHPAHGRGAWTSQAVSVGRARAKCIFPQISNHALARITSDAGEAGLSGLQYPSVGPVPDQVLHTDLTARPESKPGTIRQHPQILDQVPAISRLLGLGSCLSCTFGTDTSPVMADDASTWVFPQSRNDIKWQRTALCGQALRRGHEAVNAHGRDRWWRPPMIRQTGSAWCRCINVPLVEQEIDPLARLVHELALIRHLTDLR